MPVTEFMAEIENGPIESSAITITMIANDTNIKLFGPVILANGTITDLPNAASTTTAGDAAVFGVCVRLGRDDPGNGTKLVANTTRIEVCIYGICKLRVNDANVALNDPLETNSTVGEARIQPDPTVDATSAATVAADVVIVANNIRKCFAIALSTVTSGADSIIAAFVNINCVRGNVT